MKKFIIIYSVVSVVLLSFVVFLSLQLHTQARVLEVFGEIADNAHETGDFDTFVAYQSLGYKREAYIELTDANISIYQVIGEQNEQRLNQVVVIVNDNGTFQHATEIDDNSDKSNIRFINPDTWTAESIRTSDNYNGEAITYGMEIYGFFYGAFVIEEDREVAINIDDYNGNLFHSEILQINLIDETSDNLNQGFTEEDFDMITDRDTYITPAVITDITYYLVIDIILGAVIAFFIKRKNQ